MNSSRLQIGMAVAFVFAMTVDSAAGEIVYVDQNATGPAHDGSSWCQAYRELSIALYSLTSGDGTQIRVAGGTYLPDPSGLEDAREATFRLPDGVSIEGAYAGCGAGEPDKRDPLAHPTILSGDLNRDDGSGQTADNAYSVVTALELSVSTLLDGLTITSGGGEDVPRSRMGGGIHIGGSSIDGGTLAIQSCVFRANSSTAGGAVSNVMGSVRMDNCVLSGNFAINDGGAIFNDFAFLHLTNCTVVGNEASTGAGIRNYAGVMLQVTNSILWDNVANGSMTEAAQIENTGSTTTVNHSIVQGWTGTFEGTNSSGDDPRFIDADGQDERHGTEDDDLRLSLDSPAVNAGTLDGAPQSDLTLQERPCGEGIDLGAYENDCKAMDPDDRWIAMAWNDAQTGSGKLRATSARPPWTAVGDPLEVGRDSILRFANERLYALSRAAGTITVVDAESWTVVHRYALEEGSEPRDVAVATTETAYVTRGTAQHLLRLDLESGDTEDVVDLGIFADPDGNPDLEMMAIHEGRLFVQILRVNSAEPGTFTRPAYVAVIDIASEKLVDVDPATPGVQAIALEGTSPKLKMQIVPETRRLFLSATGGDLDHGGIEIVDLDTLQSSGMVISEADGLTGSDLGPFVLVDPDRGYLAFTTDLTLSTHLVRFSVSGGVEAPPQLFGTVGYLAPTLQMETGGGAFYCPTSGSSGDGVHVFEADTGQRVTSEPIPTNGPPTDLVVIPAPRKFKRGDVNAIDGTNITDGIFLLNFLFLGGPEPPCEDAADLDDKGTLEITDAVYLLGYLFSGGPPPGEPLGNCGVDLSADVLTCLSFEPCE